MRVSELATFLNYEINEENRCFEIISNGLVIFSAYSLHTIHEFLFSEYLKTILILDTIKLAHKSFLNSKILFSVSEKKINVRTNNVKLKAHKLTIIKKQHKQFSKKTFVKLLEKSAELALEYPAFIRRGRLTNVQQFYDEKEYLANLAEVAEVLGLVETSPAMFDEHTFLPANFVMLNENQLPLIIATKPDDEA